jgi:DNA-binding winged helix-turn-helix (wHTH) protein/Tol biopolymer transport system component
VSERPPAPRVLLIGDWRVDLATGVVSRDGTVRRLRPQVIDVLAALASRPSEVVSKQDLLDIAWKGRFVSDSPLTTTIAELREALEDDAKEPRYVQTVPKRGYRLIAAVQDISLESPAPAGREVQAAAQPEVAESRAVLQPETLATPATPATPETAGAPPLQPLRPLPSPLQQPPLQPPASQAQMPPPGPRGRTARHAFLFTATAVALASLVALSLAFTASAPPPPLVAIPITLDAGQRWPMRTAQVAALSPDGRTLVYTVETADGRRQLVRRDLQTTAVETVPGSQGASGPFFSPDGTRLGFFRQGAIHAIDAGGKDGNQEKLVDVSVAFGASWRSNGDLVFAGNYRSGLSLMTPGSMDVRPLTVLTPEQQEASHRYPTALPNSPFVLFAALGAKAARIEAVDVNTGARHTVVEDSAFARFAAPDRLLYARGAVLMSVRFDPMTARMKGSPVEIARDVANWPQTGLTQFAVSESGVLVYLTEPPRIDRELVVVDRAGQVTPLPVDAGPYVHPRLSPDGRQVAMWQEIDDARDVVVLDIASKQVTAITHDGISARPVWGPDGQRLAFDRPSTGSPANVVMAPLTPDAPAQTLLPRDRVQNVEDWLPDGRTIVVSQVEPDTGGDLHLVRLNTRQALPLANAPGPDAGVAVSPDGRWIAYGHGVAEGKEPSLAIVSTDPANTVRVDVAGSGRELRWSRDGRELFYRAGGAMFAIPLREADGRLTAGPAVELFRGAFEQRPAFRANYDVFPDGRFLMLRRRGGASTQQIIVSLNWKTPAH